MPTIEANGRSIAYQAGGDGPPLILLHGATGSGASHFATLLPRLTGAFRVLAPDARGHGATPWDPAAGFQTADLVDDVRVFADALDLASFHLLGYSMGAMTALAFAVRWPARVRSLVIVSLGVEREPRLSVGRRLMDPDRIERDDPAWARRLGARHVAWRELLPAIVNDIATQPLLSPADLRSIAAPSLVVAGDRDPFVPVVQAASLARQVRDGRLLILPGTDHDAIDSQPAILAAALDAFYARLGRGAPIDPEDLP